MPDDDSAVHDRSYFSWYLFEVRFPGLAYHLRNCLLQQPGNRKVPVSSAQTVQSFRI